MGMNPFFVPGGGDTAWVLRIDPEGNFDRRCLGWPWWRNVWSLTGENPVKDLIAVGGPTWHIWHGPFVDRQYQRRNVSVTLLTENILDGVQLDERGLVETVGPLGAAIQYLMLRKAQMTSDQEMYRLVEEAKAVLNDGV